MTQTLEYRQLGDEYDEIFHEYTGYAFDPTSGPAEYDPDDDDGWEEADRRGLVPAGDGPDERPRTICAHYWFEGRLRGEWRSTPGLSAVATPPEYRREGHVTRLLEESLAEYRDRDAICSLLWPFKHRFYRDHGWATVAAYRRYTATTEALAFARSRLDDPGTYRRLEADDYEVLEGPFEEHAARYGCSVRRSEAWWRNRVFESLRTDPYVYAWERDGEVRAYLSFTIEGDWGERTLKARDFLALDYEGLYALCAFGANHDSQVDTVQFGLPCDVDLIDVVPDPEDVECERKRGAMGRLVDAETALPALADSALPDQAPANSTATDRTHGAVILDIADPLVDWNDRPMRLEADGERVRCEPATGGSAPTVSLDIGTLTQLAVGARSASELERAGSLDGPPEAVSVLEEWFPPEPTYLGTGF